MPKDSQGLRVGIEAKIQDHPILDVLGDKYESLRRTGLNDMQKGMSENEIEKIYQSHFNIQWAWADSIATEVIVISIKFETKHSSYDNPRYDQLCLGFK